MFLAQATVKHKVIAQSLKHSAVHYQNSDTRAERLQKEKYELQNEEELSVAMVRKKELFQLTRTKTLGSTDKDERE